LRKGGLAFYVAYRLVTTGKELNDAVGWYEKDRESRGRKFLELYFLAGTYQASRETSGNGG